MKRLFLKNLNYKLAALFLATLLWYIVQGEEILEISRRLDVRVDVPKGLALKTPKIASRDVTLKGSRVLLGSFPQKNLQAVIKLQSSTKPGSYRYRLDKDFIFGWDQRIRLTIEDPNVNLVLDEEARKEVPIKLNLVGSPLRGLSIYDAKMTPAKVVVVGVKSEIDPIEYVTTQAIDIQNISKNKNVEVGLVRPEHVLIADNVERMNVELQVGEEKINRKFERIYLDVNGTDFVTGIKPTHVAVTLQGPASKLNALRLEEVKPFVDGKDLSPGKYEREVLVQLPANTSLVEVQPAKVQVEVYNQKKLKP